jgi:hypothetical protein
MQFLSQILVAVLTGTLIVPFPLVARAGSARGDLWVHPRGEAFDPSLHYRDADGNLYYLEENDLGGSIGAVRIVPGEQRIRIGLGPELRRRAERTFGSLLPVLLYDSDGDEIVDSVLRGRLQGDEVEFDGERIAALDFGRTRWQIGIRYIAGETGDPALDGRYLASLDARSARVQIESAERAAPAALPAREPEPVDVGAGPFPQGLVVLKHREGTPFDLAGFAEQPARYIEHFEALTRAADGDDWTVEGDRGTLRTHLDEEDLLLVRTEGGFNLEVTWGDLPLERFFSEFLEVPLDPRGCYVSLNTGLRNPDGTTVESPHRLLYCPAVPMALFDAPNGYEIGLSAHRNGTSEYTEASTSLPDNLRLYMREVYPRNPSARATQSVPGNVAAGFRDAGRDLADAFRHALIGKEERHVHSGQRLYRPSPVTAPPRALIALLKLRPLSAIQEIFAGAESGVQVAADLVSAVDNAVLNPVLQGTVGLVGSPDAADTAGDWIGALTQSFAKNLPLGERSDTLVDLRGAWQHDRAFEPLRYTRTDTQLNLDRGMAVLNWSTLRAIRIHNRGGSSSGGGPSPFDLPGDGTPETPLP